MQKLSEIKKEIIPYNFLYKISGLTIFLSLIPSFFIISMYSLVLPTKSIINLIFLFVLMIVLVWLLNLLEKSKNIVLEESASEIDQKIYDNVVSFIKNSKNINQTIITDIHNDLFKINKAIKKGLDFVFVEIVSSLLFLLPLVFIDIKLGLLGFIFIILIFINFKYQENKLKEYSIINNNSEKTTNNFWNDISKNNDFYDANIKNHNIKNHFLALLNKHLESSNSLADLILKNKISNKILAISVGTIFMAYSFILFINNQIDFISIILTSILSVKAITPWFGLTSYKTMKIEYEIAEKKIDSLLSTTNQENEKLDLELSYGKLEVNIIHSYPDLNSSSNLKNVLFTLMPGEILSLLGNNGSGKTALIKSITGENFLSKESYCKISGVDINNLSEKQKERNIGYLPQNTELINGSLIQNIWRFKEDHPLKEIIEKIIEKSSLKKLLDKEDVSMCSMGEIRKIMLLRTICDNPRIILLDEPESFLDEEGFIMLSNIITWAKNNKSIIIMSTNNLGIIKLANKGLLLEGGKMTKFGDIKEFIQK